MVVSVRWLLKRLDIEKILWYNKFGSDIVPLADRCHFYEKSLMFKALGSFILPLDIQHKFCYTNSTIKIGGN